MFRLFSFTALIFMACAIGSTAHATDLFQDDYEDGDAAGWSTWTCSGVTYNIVGPGFVNPLVDGSYPQSGTYGMHLRKVSGAGKTDLLVAPVSSDGPVHLSFDIRPFIVSSSTHSIIVGMSENNPGVTEARSLSFGIHFDAGGVVLARSPGYPTITPYLKNQWYHVQIDADLNLARYSLTVSGPGLPAPVTLANLQFQMPCNHVGYLSVWCNTPTTTEHGIDNFRVWDDSIPLATVACKPYYEDFSNPVELQADSTADPSHAYYLNLPDVYDLGVGCAISWDMQADSARYSGLGQSSVMGPRCFGGTFGERFPQIRFNIHYDNPSTPQVSLSYPTAPLRKDSIAVGQFYHAAITRVAPDSARLTLKNAAWTTVVEYTIPVVWRPFGAFQLCYDYYSGDEGKCAWDEASGRMAFVSDRSPGPAPYPKFRNFVAGFIDNLRIGPGNVGPVTVRIENPCTPTDLSGFQIHIDGAEGGSWDGTTDPAGVCGFAEIPFGHLTVEVLSRENYYPEEGASRQVEHQAQTDMVFAFQPAARVTGTVSANCGGGLGYVMVDLVDGAQQPHMTVTDESGLFVFPSVAPGEGNLSVNVPLGYRTLDSNGDAVSRNLSCDTEQDFTFECVPSSGSPRSMGYWKHQVQVYRLHRGSAEESEGNMTVNFPQIIFDHFYENGLNAIQLEGITYRDNGGMVRLDLETMYGILWIQGRAPMLERAKQQYLATMLNIASGKLLVRDVISEDGRTVSQAVQYLADLINALDPQTDELAKNLSESLNLGVMLPAGAIPEGYDDIHYRLAPVRPDLQAGVGQPMPNPFVGETRLTLDLAEPATVRIEAHDAAGRLIKCVANSRYEAGRHTALWNGTDGEGRRVPSGVYFLDVRAGRLSRTLSVVLVR